MLSIRILTPADIPLGMRLKELAGWNQTEADWRRHLALESAGCFVGCWNGTPAATLATTVFGGDAVAGSSAWIAMVLTDPDFRRRGIANALLEHAIETLERRGATSIWLDATEMGQPVYEKLGFRTQFQLTRRRGIAQAIESAGDGVALRPMTAEELAGGEVADLDRAATGADRLSLLASLRDGLPEAAVTAMSDPREVTAVLGFGLARSGSRATQVGPVIARTEAVGRALLAFAVRQFAGREILIDVPDRNEAANRFLQQAGVVPERAFYRMVRKSPKCEVAYEYRESEVWASAGPEYG
ncbi:MAG: GNAT family N-acetyltransferase [Planctomycetia bacterium]|nr:GNAT family N-acetyltransferase [Planctomycetia bacterium]